jgi:hypothetical protein
VRRCGRAGAALLAADALLSAFASLSVCARSYGQTIEVDYRGYDVTVENFLRVLTGACRSRVSARVRSHMSTVLTRSRCAGRHEAWVPRSKRLLSDAAANVLVYMTGHGGDEFLKFQDQARALSRIVVRPCVCVRCALACALARSPRRLPGGDLVDGHRGRAGADGGEAPLPRGTRGRLLSVSLAPPSHPLSASRTPEPRAPGCLRRCFSSRTRVRPPRWPSTSTPLVCTRIATARPGIFAHALSRTGVVAIGSSALGEPSWSYLPDSVLGLSVIDRFTHFTLQFLERVTAASQATLAQLFDSCARCARRRARARVRARVRLLLTVRAHACVRWARRYDRRLLHSTATPRTDLFGRPLSDVKITDFFGALVCAVLAFAYCALAQSLELLIDFF